MLVKKVYLLPMLVFCGMLCMSSSCRKNPIDPNGDQLSQLPPATQTGANTMGALVNGRAFVNYDDSFYSHSFQCNYIYTNGGYYLTIYGENKSTYNYIYSISLSTNALSISEGQTIKLENNNTPGKACGLYGYLFGVTPTDYETTTTVNGQLHISKLDTVKQIVSGTFFFNAINLNTSKSDTIHITDGRFDMKYTQ